MVYKIFTNKSIILIHFKTNEDFKKSFINEDYELKITTIKIHNYMFYKTINDISGSNGYSAQVLEKALLQAEYDEKIINKN
jgi:hypothetical protein